jgi:hypothetical protein
LNAPESQHPNHTRRRHAPDPRSTAMAVETIIGIDLNTTHTVVAVMERGAR